MENKEVEVKEEVKEEEIVFHDSTPQVEETKDKKTNKLATIGFSLGIVCAVLLFIPVESIFLGSIYNLCSLVGFIISIVALTKIKKNNEKGKLFAVLGVVLPILLLFVSVVLGVIEIQNMPEQEYNDTIYCPFATDCKDNGDGTSTCIYVDETEVKCTTEMLDKDQFE